MKEKLMELKEISDSQMNFMSQINNDLKSFEELLRKMPLNNKKFELDIPEFGTLIFEEDHLVINGKNLVGEKAYIRKKCWETINENIDKILEILKVY